MLAAGYATRLSPLTDSIPKVLLPLAGRPMLDYLLDRLEAVDEIDGTHVVTNARFAGDFGGWASQRSGLRPVAVWNDGTTSNEDRLGAIGDIRFTIEEAGLEGEELLVVAGDNLIEYHLEDFVRFWREKSDGAAIAVHRVPDPEMIKQVYGHYVPDSLGDTARLQAALSPSPRPSTPALP